MKKNGVFLFVISHLVPEIFKIFVLGTVHGCHCPGDMAVRMRGLMFECVTCFYCFLTS